MHIQSKEKMLSNLRSFMQSGEHGLRPHQVEALQSIESFLPIPIGGMMLPQEQIHDTPDNLPTKKGDFFEVVSATGTGKTRMFGTMAKAMNVPTLIVTPRNILNKQTKKEFCEEVGIPEEAVAVYDSRQPDKERKRVVEGNPPPQFVITSYQSLPSLLDRHELDVTNPDDVHYRPLVILDEVHEAQGPQTLKTLNKLKNNVLVAGFTATDAGVSQSLFEGQEPIYKLPLVEAIERDLLCHGIRTGTVDVAIDEAWVDNFLNTPKGADYRREDVEKFARNPSVIEAAIRFHMSHEDEQLGKISRLPTIFYTEGVDAARKGAEAFNKKAEELGLNIKAAYVSGDMKPKEYMPILERFKRGEIQALWNDKILGMGFDARNATVCYSLKPSRISHVVEQQLGRVGRKQGDDYVEKYGQDKVALAINVRGKGMNPLLYGEVLGGKPAIYSGSYTRPEGGKSGGGTITPPPDMPEGMDVHIDYSDMNSVLSGAIRGREGLPEKTPEWLVNKEMSERTKRAYDTLSSIYKSLQAAWEEAKANGEEIFSAEGITLPTDKVGLFKSRTQTVFCLHEDTMPLFSTPQKTPEWLILNEMAARARKASKTLSPIYKALQTAWEKAKANGEESFSAEGITISTDKAGIFQNVHNRAFCLHEDTMPLFSIQQKRSEWLAGSEMAARVKMARENLSPVYKALQAAWEDAKVNGADRFSAEGITIPTDKAGLFQSISKTLFCLHEDTVPLFSIPQKTSEWLIIREMAARARRSPSTVNPIYKTLQAAWERAKANGAPSFTANGITIPTDKAGIFQSGPTKPFCLHESLADVIRNYHPPTKSHTEQAEKRDISPDSPHLKRTGRTRSKEE